MNRGLQYLSQKIAAAELHIAELFSQLEQRERVIQELEKKIADLTPKGDE